MKKNAAKGTWRAALWRAGRERQRGRERKGGGDEHTSFEDDTREEIATKKVR